MKFELFYHGPVFRSLFAVLALLFCYPCRNACATDSASGSGATVVAEINSVDIDLGTLERELVERFQAFFIDASPKERHGLMRYVLREMIRRELLRQAERSSGIELTPEEKSGLMRRETLRTLSQTAFEEKLSPRGEFDVEFMRDLEESARIRKYLNKAVFADVSVSEEEMREAYPRIGKSLMTPEERKLGQILLRVPESAGREDWERAHDRALEIRSEMEGKEDEFADFARRYSESADRRKGGDLGYFTRNQFSPEISDELFLMKAGEVSKPIRSRFGWHIFKVEEIRPRHLPSYDEIRTAIAERLLFEKREKAFFSHLEDLRSRARVIVYFQ